MSDVCVAAALYAAGEPQLQLLLYDSCLCVIKSVAQYRRSIAHSWQRAALRCINEREGKQGLLPVYLENSKII